jgi:RimJ/RimL family protein N-acetyltransferase
MLDRLDGLKMPLSYGSDACRLVLADERFSKDIVALRNNPRVNAFIHRGGLTEEAHNRWLARQMERRDALNFVILVRGRFAGTVSLYDISPGKDCEYGRLVMPDNTARIFALAVEFLCLSLAFEILGMRSVHCRVARPNAAVYGFHRANGWQDDASYDEDITVAEGEVIPHAGLSIALDDWPTAFARAKRLLQRLHHAI